MPAKAVFTMLRGRYAIRFAIAVSSCRTGPRAELSLCEALWDILGGTLEPVVLPRFDVDHDWLKNGRHCRQTP
jgi:hypothetical protein